MLHKLKKCRRGCLPTGKAPRRYSFVSAKLLLSTSVYWAATAFISPMGEYFFFKDPLAVACGEDLQRVAAADALGAAGSRCGKWMHIFSFRAVRACILWAKHWTAPAAAAASNCTGPSAAGPRQGGTPPAVFSGSGKIAVQKCGTPGVCPHRVPRPAAFQRHLPVD